MCVCVCCLTSVFCGNFISNSVLVLTLPAQQMVADLEGNC